jgi:hypothetical protein
MDGTLYFCNDDLGQEFELEISFDYHYDGGHYGRWEDSYPSEESADITHIYNYDKKPSWITDEMIDKAFDDQLSDLLEGNEPEYED